MKNYLIDFEIGDYSHDGHGQSSTYFYNSNIEPKAVRKALQEASEYMKNICGYGIDDICTDYDDTAVPEEAIGYLYEIGFFDVDISIEDLSAEGNDKEISLKEWASLNNEEKEEYSFKFVQDYSDYSNFHGGEDFVGLMLLMIKSKLPEFEYSVATNDSANIFSGGYGFGY